MFELLGKFEERRRLEEQATGAVGRIEASGGGSWSRGRAGENLLAAALGEFPPDMVQRDFTLGGRVCEFALALPDGKVLPIDSKWPSVEIAARLQEELDPAARDELRRRVEKVVCGRLREVAGYVDASLTAPLAVMAVPDAVYACCRKAHRLAKDARVLIVSYSLAVPVLMAVWNSTAPTRAKSTRPRRSHGFTRFRSTCRRWGTGSRGSSPAASRWPATPRRRCAHW